MARKASPLKSLRLKRSKKERGTDDCRNQFEYFTGMNKIPPPSFFSWLLELEPIRQSGCRGMRKPRGKNFSLNLHPTLAFGDSKNHPLNLHTLLFFTRVWDTSHSMGSYIYIFSKGDFSICLWNESAYVMCMHIIDFYSFIYFIKEFVSLCKLF